jgi:hypothetical protein
MIDSIVRLTPTKDRRSKKDSFKRSIFHISLLLLKISYGLGRVEPGWNTATLLEHNYRNPDDIK